MTNADRIRVLAILLPALFSASGVPAQSSGVSDTSASPLCGVERRRAQRDGVDMEWLEVETAAAAKATRAVALRAIENFRASSSMAPADRAWVAYFLCAYEARLTQLPAPAPVTIVSTQRAGTVTGNFASSFVQEWAGATLETPSGSGATPWLEAIAALEAGAADGSRLLLTTLPLPTASSARQVIDALAPLKRIRMLAGPRAANPTNSGVALFAPSRTPADRVAQLTAQAREAESGPTVSGALERAQYVRPTANITATLASLREQLPPEGSATDVTTAPTPGTSTQGSVARATGAGSNNLRPTDFFLEERPDGYIAVLVGKTLPEALATLVKYTSRTTATVQPGYAYHSCSQLVGEMRVGWFAVILADLNPLRPFAQRVDKRDVAWGMACGKATVDQAIATAYDAAKQKVSHRPFGTFRVEAAVTAELDLNRLAVEGRLFNNSFEYLKLAAWTTQCEMPIHLEQAVTSFRPPDPGNGETFARMLMSPAMKAREYTYSLHGGQHKKWFGCSSFVNTPEPNQPPPVFAR